MATKITRKLMENEAAKVFRLVLETHAAWLNGWHEHMDEDTRVKLDDYWLDLGDTGVDGPVLLLDTWSTIRDEEHWNAGARYGEDHRMLVIECTPYHDEGGSSVLTAFLERDWQDGVLGYEAGEWELRCLVQEFDTIHDLLMSEGKLVWKF
jgi:hypothetical protein